MHNYLSSAVILLATSLHVLCIVEIPLRQTISQAGLSVVRFSSEWQVLGPFQIGTREAAWGADPLERYGGFRNIEYDPSADFPSSLTPNATVKWWEINSTTSRWGDSLASASLELALPNVNWKFQQSVYGWPALQYQAWIRGQILLEGDSLRRFIVITDGVLEFRINKKLYWGGDYYGYRKSPPVLHLSPGIHRLEMRLIRDVRALGGSLPPTVKVSIELRQQFDALVTDNEHSVFPDATGATLSSDLASVKVRNNQNSCIVVSDIWLNNHDEYIKLLKPLVRIHPGQTRPVAFRFQISKEIPKILHFTLEAHHERDETPLHLDFSYPLKQRNISDPHKFTFLHPSGIVSYAVLRPPPLASKALDGGKNVPVLIGLHGAGVEADSPMVRHSLDATSDLPAWTVFPTGVNPWSADDWHQWGFADVEASIYAISDWIKHVGWDGPGIEAEKWMVTGHSNGGQGTWYITTHRPDNVIAAVPASAYSSIQKYVPYTFWEETDPFRTAVVQAALGSYHHESLLGNCKDIPVMMQHGGEDDNVPVFQSRRMMDLAAQHGLPTEFFEVPGQGHYWDGVMTTDVLMGFYRKHLLQPRQNAIQLTDFTLTVANPADTGSKAGFLVYDLIHPGQLGRLSVTVLDNLIKIRTSNVRSFVAPTALLQSPTVLIDRTRMARGGLTNDDGLRRGFILDEKDEWKVIPVEDLFCQDRSPGGLEAILRSKDSFAVISLQESTNALALQIARNLYQYFSADVEILEHAESAKLSKGNVIRLGMGDIGHPTPNEEHPIWLGSQEIKVRDDRGRIRTYVADEHGLAAIYLRRLARGRLELVIWGTDLDNLELISRLVPLMTGAGQPDFVIADRRMAWEGVQGVLAMGFFDGDWNVSRTSFLL